MDTFGKYLDKMYEHPYCAEYSYFFSKSPPLFRRFEKHWRISDLEAMLASLFAHTQLLSETLHLYPIGEADLPDLASWPKYQDSNLSWANFPASTKELQRRWLQHQKQNHIVWIMVRERSTNTLIGRCSYTQPISSNEILYGVVLNPDYVEQGYGTLITQLTLSYAFQVTNIDAVWLESKYNNIRAHNTWRKVGFEELGYHFRREVFGRYDKYIGFRFPRSQLDILPDVMVSKRKSK